MNMGITIQEFQFAMETIKAVRLEDNGGSRFPSILVPCFQVKDAVFLHSASYYVVQRGTRYYQLEEQAMKVFGEKKPGGDNFWYGEIHSVRGLLTLATMIEGRYSKELVDRLTNETYQKIFDNILPNEEIQIVRFNSPKMEELYQLIEKYDQIVNLFINSDVKLKQPSEYLNKINISVCSDKGNTRLFLKTKDVKVKYAKNEKGCFYETEETHDAKRQDDGYTSIIHYFTNKTKNKDADEVIFLDYCTNSRKMANDINLRISLKTGLAWSTHHEKEARHVTDYEIQRMTIHLKRQIKKVRQKIINNMIEGKI